MQIQSIAPVNERDAHVVELVTVRRQIIRDSLALFRSEALASPWMSLCVFGLVAQAVGEHGFLFGFLSLSQGMLCTPEVDGRVSELVEI